MASNSFFDRFETSRTTIKCATDVWKFDTGNNQVIEPTLPGRHFGYGIALYAVDANFGEKN